VVVAVDLLMSLFFLRRLDFSFLAEERWGGTSITAVAGFGRWWLRSLQPSQQSLFSIAVACPCCAKA